MAPTSVPNGTEIGIWIDGCLDECPASVCREATLRRHTPATDLGTMKVARAAFRREENCPDRSRSATYACSARRFRRYRNIWQRVSAIQRERKAFCPAGAEDAGRRQMLSRRAVAVNLTTNSRIDGSHVRFSLRGQSAALRTEQADLAPSKIFEPGSSRLSRVTRKTAAPPAPNV